MGRKDERGWPGLRAHAPCTGWGPTARDQKDRPVATRRGVSRFMAVTHRVKKAHLRETHADGTAVRQRPVNWMMLNVLSSVRNLQ